MFFVLHDKGFLINYKRKKKISVLNYLIVMKREREGESILKIIESNITNPLEPLHATFVLAY